MRTPSIVACLAVCKNQISCYAGCYDGKILCIDLKRTSNSSWFKAHDNGVSSILVSGNSLYSGSVDGIIKFWNILNKSEIARITTVLPIIKLFFNRNSIVSFHSNIILSWSLEAKNCLISKPIDTINGLNAATSKKSPYFVVGYANGKIEVFNKLNLKSLSTKHFCYSPVLHIAVKNDVCLSADNTGAAVLWKLPEFFMIKYFKNTEIIYSVFSPTQDLIYLFNRKGVFSEYYFKYSKFRIFNEHKCFNPSALCISSDHKILAYGNRLVCLYSLTKCKLIRQKDLNLEIATLRFSNDNKMLVCGVENGYLYCLSMPFLIVTNKLSLNTAIEFISVALNKDLFAVYCQIIKELRFIDSQGTSIAKCMPVIVSSGEFCEAKSFIFSDSHTANVWIFKKLQYLVLVYRDIMCFQIYLSADKNVLCCLDNKTKFLIIDLKNDKICIWLKTKLITERR